MLTIMSTKGTAATTHLNSSGRMFTALPMSNPPALRPEMASFDVEVQPVATRCSATSTKSLNVFFFARYLPSFSYQCRPISPPPRTCATAITTPRSIRGTSSLENVGSLLTP